MGVAVAWLGLIEGVSDGLLPQAFIDYWEKVS
jgi:hypothetical protein